MHHRAALLVLAVVAPAAASPGLSLVDDVDRSLRLKATPQRIVSTAPSNTAALFALGVGERVVGVTSYCTYPPEARDRPRIGDFSSLDLEAIIALEPDLIVATWLEQRRHVARLEELGLPVFVVYPTDLDSTLASLVSLGRAVGAEERAAELVEGLERRLAAMQRRVASLAPSDRPLVFVELNAAPLYTAGPGSTVHEAIVRAGGRNLAVDLGKPYSTITAEVVIAAEPEVVLLGMGAGDGDPVAEIAAQAGFDQLPAVRDGRVHRIDPGLLFHHNHRLVDGIEELHRLFHGDQSGAP